MAFQGQSLVDGREWLLPDWLKKGNFGAKELVSILQDHVRHIVQHFKGKIYTWILFNELGSRDDGIRNWWIDHLGRTNLVDWVETIFRTANEADPSARFLLNDFGIEYGGSKADEVYALVRSLKDRRVAIHGMGFQFHLDGGHFVGDQLAQKTAATRAEIGRYDA